VVKLCAAATLGIALSVLGQESGNHYEALKQALGLSDAQLSQLQQRRPTALDDSQRTSLAAIRKVLDRWDAADLALGVGLIDEKLWPAGMLCPFSSVRAYAYAKELGLSDAQVAQLDQLGQTARATHTVPPRDLALAVLDDTQKVKLAEFETALQVANEAIELGLILKRGRPEVLCH
jgi:hypothetical protein